MSVEQYLQTGAGQFVASISILGVLVACLATWARVSEPTKEETK